MIQFPTSGRTGSIATRAWLASVACGALLLGGCNSKPAGQVAATVDGSEITLSELNAELAGVQVPEGSDKKLLQQQALQRVIDRKVMANAARTDGLDQSPEFVVRRQQLEDALLVQLLTRKIARDVKVPNSSQVDKFMTSNPNMFSGRTIYTVDQIRFAMPPRDDYMKPMADAHSMQAVIEILDRLGIKYERGTARLDSAQVPRAAMEQISKVPAGEPFVIPAGNMITVSLITGNMPAPLAGETARPLAVNAERNMQLGEKVDERLKTEKAKAQITYQPGFAPPTGAAKGAASPAPKK